MIFALFSRKINASVACKNAIDLLTRTCAFKLVFVIYQKLDCVSLKRKWKKKSLWKACKSTYWVRLL